MTEAAQCTQGAALRVVVFAVGNESRGDDALGPRLACWLEQQAWPRVSVVADFQLQVEHALDMEGADLVLFVDAACAQPTALAFTELVPQAGRTAFSHALAPQAVLGVYAACQGTPPPAFLLGVAGALFGLGEELSDTGRQAEVEAQGFLRLLLEDATPARWRALAGAPGQPPMRGKNSAT